MKNKIFKQVIFCLFSCFFLISILNAGSLQVTFVDVGQGDCIFIQTPQGKNILIDAGGMPSWYETKYDIGKNVVTPFLKKRKIENLDVVLLTHPDGDHVGGLAAVLNYFPVKLVLDTKASLNVTSDEYLEFLETIKAKKIPYKIVYQGQELLWDKDLKVEVYNPVKDFSYPKSNNNSVVLKISYRKISFLLCGDIEKVVERRLIRNYGSGLQATVLKIPHHGSKTSSTANFLDKVRSECAIISCGRQNPFGHPHPETIQKLKRKKMKTYNTAKNGNITVKTNGKIYEVTTEY